MSLRKIAGLLAGGGLVVGLIGGGVGAQFTDSVQAIQHISVGTFSCVISDGGGGVLSNNNKTVTFSTFNITSSAAGSDPIHFTVKNTGSIGDVLTVSTTPVQDPPFSIIGMPFDPVPLAPGETHLYNTGVRWETLDNSNLGQQGDVTWTVNCGEAAAAGGTAIFDNTDHAAPLTNPASYGPQAYSYNEWGGGVTFAGTARNLSTATVTLSSWACQTGDWTLGAACVTTAGATYSVPITFALYNVSGGVVGSEITHMTQTFTIPYRPSGGDATNCRSDATAYFDGTSCVHGKPINITFSFPSGTTLPSTAVFGISFATTSDGLPGAPALGAGTNPTDALNIGTFPGTDFATQAEIGTWLPDDVSTYVVPRSGTTMVGLSPVTHMPTASGDTFVSYMPAVQITATNQTTN